MPRRGDLTTISVSREIKRRLDRLRGDKTYDEFFDDMFSPEMTRRLDLFKRPVEGYGDALRRAMRRKPRDPGELDGFLHQAELFRRTGKVRVLKKGPKVVRVIVEPWR